MRDAALRLGASHVEAEAFDLRGGVGPDLSLTVDELLSEVTRSPMWRRRPRHRPQLRDEPSKG